MIIPTFNDNINPKDCLLRVWDQIAELFISHREHAGVYENDNLMGIKPHKLPSNSRGQNKKTKDQIIHSIWTLHIVIHVSNNDFP